MGIDYTYINSNGFKFYVRMPEGYQDVKVISEVITEDTYGILSMQECGFEPETILDIGGHIGSFGVFAKSLWPNAKLIAVEPDPVNYELYKRNIKENTSYLKWERGKAGANESVVINAAVSYDTKRNYIVKSPRTSGGWFLRNEDEARWCITANETRCNEMKKIKTVTLEEITKDIDRIDLIKIDCEGGEWDILLNFTQPEKILYMMGETHVRKSHWDVPFREPNDNFFWRIKVWDVIKRRYPHLNFIYDYKRRGLFQAGPKVA